MEDEGLCTATSVCKYQAKTKVYDIDAVCRMLFGDAGVKKEITNYGTGSTEIMQGENHIMWNDEMFQFYENQNARDIALPIFDHLFANKRSPVDVKKEVDALFHDAIVAEGTQKIKQIFSLHDEDIVLSGGIILNEDIKEVVSSFDADFADAVNDTKEYLCLRYDLKKDGIPFMGENEPPQGYVVEVSSAPVTFIRVLLCDGRIIAMEAQGMFDYEKADSVDILSENDAKKIGDEEISTIITGKSLALKEIKLEYVPIPDFSAKIYKIEEARPYWCIIYTDDEGNEFASRINAITGGDLSYGE